MNFLVCFSFIPSQVCRKPVTLRILQQRSHNIVETTEHPLFSYKLKFAENYELNFTLQYNITLIFIAFAADNDTDLFEMCLRRIVNKLQTASKLKHEDH